MNARGLIVSSLMTMAVIALVFRVEAVRKVVTGV